jgi:hypothetical protein
MLVFKEFFLMILLMWKKSVCAGWLDGSSEEKKGTTQVAAGFG